MGDRHFQAMGRRTVYAMAILATLALAAAVFYAPAVKDCPPDVTIGDAIKVSGCR